MLRLPCTCSIRPVATPTFARAIHAPASLPPLARVPKPRAPFDSPASILTASKRGLDQFADKFDSFAALFSKTSTQLRDEVGMNIKQSRYLLNLLEKYRQGINPDQVAVPEKPKKVIRGWGPRVQNGVRVR